MTYLYEQLSPDRFQQFCQSLLAIQFPNAQCLPVGQPDGGRDAFQWAMRDPENRSEDLIVFQVKFSRDPSRANSDFLRSIVETELPKIERLKKKGLSAYYLLTNVSGSAHLDVGTIDKVDDILKQAVGIPAQCWWRDDLDRRVDAHADIKWSYPEIIRGSDLLQALFEGTFGEDGRRRDNALQAYLAAQFDDDKEVKFKQVDLTHNLLDLFVDTSLQFADPEERLHRHAVFSQRAYLGGATISEAEYRILGRMLRDAAKEEKYTTIVDIVRQLALTGCRRSEMIGLKWTEADTEASCLRLEDSKEGESIRPIGLPVVEYLERRRTLNVGTFVFPGQGEDNAFGSFPSHWKKLFEDSPLSDITPHVLRHSFASIANDLGFTEVTIAALVGHAKGSVTSKYIHTLDTALIMAADTISGYVQGLLDGIEFKQTAYALDRDSRKAALARFLKRASTGGSGEEEHRLAA